MLKILQARLQQYVNCELPDVQAGFRKGRGPRNQIALGKQWKQWLTLFFWAPKSLQIVIGAMKLKEAYSLEGKL